MVENGVAGAKYILQKINNNLFKETDKLMNNIRLITEHTCKKVAERGGDSDRGSKQFDKMKRIIDLY